VRRLLLFVCTVGAAVYLLTPPSKTTDGLPDSASAFQTPTDHQIRGPLSSSWGSTLRSLRQDQEAAWVSTQRPTSALPKPGSASTPNIEAQESQLARVTQPAPQPHQASVTTDETERDAVKWVRLTQAVRVRSKPSVSSPDLRLYPAGSKAQIVGRKNGWVQVLNPTTNERGWVYHSYLASIDNPKADSSVPPVKVASPRSPKPTHTAKPTIRASGVAKVSQVKRRHDRQARPTERRRLFGLFKRRKARRAWSLGRSP
jgi:uncharacterized protein YraI